jgi:hypothetical protein
MTWHLKAKDLKNYPHFDPQLSIKGGTALATNPTRVASHKFFPFMLYTKRWTRFAEKGKLGDSKERPIRYAARGDAYIFAYYRSLLGEKYEAALSQHSLQENVIAYRRIRNADGSGKCNIHFARDAFLKIQEMGNCCVVALDISSFFESLDHEILRSVWCSLIGEKRLPDDHFRVFRAITRYAVVEKESVYGRLGFFGHKRKSKAGKPINGYLLPFDKMPKQLCSAKEFREKIVGGNGTPSLINVNFKPFGIPQGSPISDLLANAYLINFDIAVKALLDSLGGAYFRYSDDILLVAPGGLEEGENLMDTVRGMIGKHGSKLVIKEKKSSVFVFTKLKDGQNCKLVRGTQGKNGVEYLGFRYDGKKIFIKDATLSNLNRKITRSAKRQAFALVRRYPNKNLSYLSDRFDFEKLIQNFGRVKDFGELSDDYRNWTFWTYARRAAKVFGSQGNAILMQLRSHRQNVKRRGVTALLDAVK